MSHFPHIEYPIRVPYLLRVYFTEGAFDIGNPLFRDLTCSRESGNRRKVLIYVDEAVSLAMPDLGNSVVKYFDHYSEELRLMGFETLEGGEALKNDASCLDRIYGDIERLRLPESPRAA